MNFSEISKGDIIRITTAAHSAPAGFGGKMRDVPEKVRTVRVDAIADVPGQPGRKQALCTVMIADDGEVFDLTSQTFRPPSFKFYSDSRGTGEQTFEKV